VPTPEPLETDSWFQFNLKLGESANREVFWGQNLEFLLDQRTDFVKQTKNPKVQLMFDKSNCQWLDTVRPISWRDPRYKRTYDMVVLGGGAGGLAVASSIAKLGAKVAVVE
jgi:hypothetical protein